MSDIQIYRPLTEYEQAAKIDYVEMDARFNRHLQATETKLVAEIKAMEQKAVNQVKRHKILQKGRHSLIPKVTINTAKLRAGMLNAYMFVYTEGRIDARKEVSNSLNKRLRFRFADAVDLTPQESMERFGKRAVMSKSQFLKIAPRERARAFTVAGVIEKDMLSVIRTNIIRGIDQGWTLQDFSRSLREANVKYTGTVFGTDAKKGQPLKPSHLETILRTNFSTVYNSGRQDFMNHPDVVEFVPAYQYSAILDTRTRDTHAAMDGRIYLRDDPIWNEWTPPNGFNCRCILVPVTSNISFSVSNPTTLRADTGFRQAA